MKGKGCASWFGQFIVDTADLEGDPVSFGRGRFSIPEQDSAPFWYKISEALYPQWAINVSYKS